MSIINLTIFPIKEVLNFFVIAFVENIIMRFLYITIKIYHFVSHNFFFIVFLSFQRYILLHSFCRNIIPTFFSNSMKHRIETNGVLHNCLDSTKVLMMR